VSLSSQLAFEDFMRRQTPIRVQLERLHLPAADLKARAYQALTDDLTAALNSGSSVRLEAAIFATKDAA